MTLMSLNDFFAKDKDLHKPLFINDDIVYDKHKVSSLIKKYIRIAESFAENECILFVQDNLLFIIAYFALLHSHKRIILPSNIRKSTLETLAVKNIFTDSLEQLDGYKIHHLNFELKNTTEHPILPFDSKNSKIVFFTSGSTGEPKQINKSFHCLTNELSTVDKLLHSKISPELTTIMTVNVFHLYGMTFAFLYSLAKGLLIDTTRIKTPEELKYKLQKYSKTFLISSPAFLDRLARYKTQYKFDNQVQITMSSGGPLSKAGAEVGQDLLGSIPLEIFGSTETGAVGWRCQLQDEYWEVLDGMEASLTQESRLCVKSDYIDGYEYTMDDAAEFISPRKFILKGRLGRMVKIEEKRVSLPEIEKALTAHKLIDKVYCIAITNKSLRKEVGACVSLNREGRIFILKFGRKALVEELKQYIMQLADRVAIPAKWRFIDEIPLNSQSKIQIAEIENLFASNIFEPVVLNKEILAQTANLEIAFLEGSSYFEGHFPGFAILPAVAQIHFAAYFANKVWPDSLFGKNLKITRISKIKFSNMIHPGQVLKLELIRGENELLFRYYAELGNFSSGCFLFGE